MTSLAPGDRLDRYELLCVLAQGGMGTVWLARLTGKHGFERLVAVKTILSTHDGDRHFSDMFLDEGRIAAQIDHENVARILEIGEDRGVIYHAMELIDGESLRKLYRDVRATDAPFPLGVALRITADVCAGLHAVHELRASDGSPLEVVHRDISPQNVLVTVRGTVKLIDFGVAKARERRTEDTTAGTLKGKIEYMAPEQARTEALDRRADVYSVGAVLYELLAGKPVRRTDEGRQLLALHELMTGVPHEPLDESIPLPVRVLVDRALARDPLLRFSSADDMRHAVEHVMSSLGYVTTTDEVASVLHHFSHERTQRRKDAIEAASRAAQALGRERPAPGGSRSGGGRSESIRPSASRSVPAEVDNGFLGGNETRRMGTAPPAPTDAPSTGPSMRTMQGATMSEGPPAFPPEPLPFRTGTMLGLLSIVVLVGIVGGMLISHRNDEPPATLGSTSVTSMSSPATPPAPSAGPTAVVPPTVITAPPTVIDDSPAPAGTREVADDAGAAATSSGAGKAATVRKPPPPPPPPPPPVVKPVPRPSTKPATGPDGF